MKNFYSSRDSIKKMKRQSTDWEKMDKTYNLQGLTHEEIENLNRTITSKEIESEIKNLQIKKSLGISLVISTKHLINN